MNARSVKAFGEELKRALHQSPLRHLKVGALAQRLGISQSTLYAYLAGTTLPPSDVLDLLLHELAVPAEAARALSTARDELDTRRRKPRAASPAAVVRPRVVPRELPIAPARFTGREAESALLDAARAEAAAGGPGVVVLSGQPGVGKTALAVHWGHQVADGFTDGVLYVDLLGFSAREPRDPHDVLAAFLRSLGTSDVAIPTDPDERVNRWRSAVAGRQLLVLLDNALDAEQVRPLLPGSGESLTVVTSRRTLSGLAVSPGAQPLALEPLAPRAAARLLRAQLRGVPGVPALADRCGGLPLLLRIVAARLAVEPAALDGLTGLDGLDSGDSGDPATSVRAVFGWSEQRLSPAAGRAFRLLGSAPVAALEPDDLTAYLGVTASAAERALAELVDAHLVGLDARGATTMHDLLADYSRDRAARETGLAEARERLLDHLVARLGAAVEVLHPLESRNVTSEADVDAARRWLDAHWTDLVDLVGATLAAGELARTTALAGGLRRHLDESGRHLDGIRVLEAGRAAARAQGLVSEELSLTSTLGAGCLRLGRPGEAVAHYLEVIEIAGRTGDGYAEAGALNNLGNVQEQQGAYADALASYDRAWTIARDLGLEHGVATLGINIGVVHLRLGEPELALRHTEEALAIFDRLGNRGGSARALGNLGEIQAALGDAATARAHLDEALALARSVGAEGVETDLLNTLGEVLLGDGAPAESSAAHERALTAATAAGDRYEEARAHAGLAAAASCRGEADTAVTHWTEAHARYAELGLPQAERAAQAIATLTAKSA